MIVVPRLVRTLLALLAGAALGGLADVLLSGHGGLSWVGAVLGVAWVVLVDALRGRRLVEWLRGAQESAAPRGSPQRRLKEKTATPLRLFGTCSMRPPGIASSSVGTWALSSGG